MANSLDFVSTSWELLIFCCRFEGLANHWSVMRSSELGPNKAHLPVFSQAGVVNAVQSVVLQTTFPPPSCPAAIGPNRWLRGPTSQHTIPPTDVCSRPSCFTPSFPPYHLNRPSTAASPKQGDLMSTRFSCTNHALGALHDIAESEIPDFVRFVTERCADLFENDPNWHTPLLLAPNGLIALSELPTTVLTKIFASNNQKGTSSLMTICLRVQSAFHSPQQQSKDLAAFVSLFKRSAISTSSLFTEISHYIHPTQSQALAELLQQFSHHSSPYSPIHKQSNVPPQLLPLLFPNVDTTLFSPQYDWFMYLLSKYSPITTETYKKQLDAHIDQHIEALLDDTYSIPTHFIHNNLFNSYDEYLQFKLPQLLTDQHINIPPTHNTLPSIFSYFPNDHPLIPTITQPTKTTDAPYLVYFVWTFLLGTSLLAQHPSEFYLLNPEQLFHFDPISFYLRFAAPSLGYQLAAYRYRTYLLSIDAQRLSDHFKLNSKSQPMDSNPTLRTTPPTFTNPYFPIQLTLLSKSQLCDKTHDILSPTLLQDSGLFSKVITYTPDLALMVYHVLKDHPKDSLDSYLLSTIEGFSYQINNQYLIETWAYANIHLSPNPCKAFPLLLILRSYQLFLQGNNTFHQHLFHHMMLVDPAKDFEQYNNFHSALLLPFLHCASSSHIIQKHLILCLHAGFLHPLPLQPAILAALPTFKAGLTKHLASFETRLAHSLPHVHRALIPFRAFIHSYLLQLVNFEVYFESKSNTLIDFIPTLSLDARFTPSRINNLDKIPPQRFPNLTANPINANPQVSSALVGIDGHIYALAFQPSDQPHGANPPAVQLELIDDNPFFPDEFFAPRQDSKFFTRQEGPFVQPCPYSRPLVSGQQQARIESPENQLTLRSVPARRLQNDFSRYRGELGVLETGMVVEHIQKVLNLVALSGLADKVDPQPSPGSSPSFSWLINTVFPMRLRIWIDQLESTCLWWNIQM